MSLITKLERQRRDGWSLRNIRENPNFVSALLRLLEIRKIAQTIKKPPKAEAVHISPSEESITIRTPLTTSKMPQMDETSSVASDSSVSHTHIRLSLFVLYVSEVKSTWPESGRSRKVVDIDEAIKMCESRPEFLAALKEVKERNLHHLPEHEKEKQVIEER
jgi:hypothetical protein